MMSFGRIYAMILRYFYILRKSWPRILDLIYWPTMHMVLWGFISQYFAASSAHIPYVVGALLGAALLWEMLFRSQLSVSLSFMEELWSRNIGHLCVSPLRPAEWIVSMICISIIRTLIGVTPVLFLAMWIYDFNIFSIGLPLAALIINVWVMGWWLGLFITSILMRAGLGAEGFCYALTFLFAPLCAVYYPISALPEAVQVVSRALPASHVFEGLRGILLNGEFHAEYLWRAAGLNAVYFVIATGCFFWSLDRSRKHGGLLQTGE
ncbi:MAG: ABC transporter permease [Pseudomonadota bacterium]|jgi:ABC-2 type transport system permease protein|nr:ABC transporter permease [Pseudomonadota bacterium]QKK05439.1 MAG: ABC transporter permease [Pseudomonadota bacterium]|tara:strand:- start:1176 stop:1970 length:795 start_codon:yes stop_codon:yes gene_type:complete